MREGKRIAIEICLLDVSHDKVKDGFEGALALALLLLEREERVLVHVVSPLGLEDEIVVHALVAEEHVLVAPVGGGELGLEHKLGDHSLSTAELLGLVHSVNVVQDGLSWDGCKVHVEVSGSLSGALSELKVTSGLKAHHEGEDGRFGSAILGIAGEIGETQLSDPLCLSGEVGLERLERDLGGVRNVVSEIVSEPVHSGLAVDGVHGDDVCRVDAVTEELDAHARSQAWRLGVLRSSRRESGIASIAASENTGVWVTTEILPLDLSDATNSMNCLISAAVPVALKLIALGIEDRGLINDQSAGEMPAA